jgi:hypothetical protein
MNNVDKISRDAKILIDSAKDTVTTNLIEAIKTSLISLNQDQLGNILNIVSTSLDTGYQKSLPVYQNMIKKHISG